MKMLFIILIAAVVSSTAIAQEPSPKTEQAITSYLEALKSTDVSVRTDALKNLSELKSMYPNYKMVEFDNFLSSQIMKKSTMNWKSMLTSPNAGIRHSTLHVLARLKSDFPELDLSIFDKELNKMISQDPSRHIQVDAKIASVYISDSKMAKEIKVAEDTAPGDAFTQILLEMDNYFAANVTDAN